MIHINFVTLYIFQVVAFCFELFYMYSGITYSGCHVIAEQVDQILKDCPSKGLIPNADALKAQALRQKSPNFNSCHHGGRVVDSFVTMFFLVQTVSYFLTITLEAANASESAMQGFQILRRHGFMYCTRRKERNFVS